jgi:PKD repeat protein
VSITVSFTVTSSGGNPSGDVQVTDGNGGGCSASVSTGNCSYTPAGAGLRTITARYQGNSSFSASEGTADHTVNDAPPANATPSAVIGSISCTGMDCTFTDASTDPDGSQTIAKWNWVFGDGQDSNDRNPSHQYAAVGDYTVTLTVTDDHEATGSTSQGLTVQLPAGGARAGAPLAQARHS